MVSIDTSLSYRVMQIDEGLISSTYSVQWKKWWWPIYVTCSGPVRLSDGVAVNRSNSIFGSIEDAAEYAMCHARYNTTFKPKVAGYLDV